MFVPPDVGGLRPSISVHSYTDVLACSAAMHINDVGVESNLYQVPSHIDTLPFVVASLVLLASSNSSPTAHCPLPHASTLPPIDIMVNHEQYGFSTRAIHVGSEPDSLTGAVIPAITLSTKGNHLNCVSRFFQYRDASHPMILCIPVQGK